MIAPVFWRTHARAPTLSQDRGLAWLVGTWCLRCSGSGSIECKKAANYCCDYASHHHSRAYHMAVDNRTKLTRVRTCFSRAQRDAYTHLCISRCISRSFRRVRTVACLSVPNLYVSSRIYLSLSRLRQYVSHAICVLFRTRTRARGRTEREQCLGLRQPMRGVARTPCNETNSTGHIQTQRRRNSTTTPVAQTTSPHTAPLKFRSCAPEDFALVQAQTLKGLLSERKDARTKQDPEIITIAGMRNEGNATRPPSPT